MTELRRVLGIDPGLAATGFAVVDGDGRAAAVVTSGVIRTKSKDERSQRLARIFEHIGLLIEKHGPEELALEQQYVASNVRSAFVIGEVRSVAMVAAATRSVSVYEYAPTAVKEALTGYGAAPKEQVRHMVMVHLGLAELPSSLDASDAMAIALTRLGELRLEAAFSRRDER